MKDKKMKRFLVFGYDRYYPSGGWNDFKDSFDTKDEAQEYAQSLKDQKVVDFSHVVDTITGDTV